MEITKAKQGTYKVRKMIQGKRHTLTFIDKPTRKDIQAKVIEQIKQDTKTLANITLAKAINNYIDNKSKVLSPSTIKNYVYILHTLPTNLLNTKLELITTQQLQYYVNQESNKHKSKTLRNRTSLILATLDYYSIDKLIKVKFKRDIKDTPYIPTDKDIEEISKQLQHTKYYTFFALCLYGLRVSEILALEKQDLAADGTLTINKALVKDINGKWKLKTTKTENSTRQIQLDKKLTAAILNQDKVILTTYTAFFRKLTKLQQQLNLQKFTPHKLRHYMASKLHSLNTPTAYIQKMGGWHTDTTLKQVYTHTLTTQEKIYNALLTDTIEELTTHPPHLLQHNKSKKRERKNKHYEERNKEKKDFTNSN